MPVDAPYPSQTRKPAMVVAVAMALAGVLLFFWFQGQGARNTPLITAEPSVAEMAPAPDSDDQRPSFDIVRISRGGTGIIAGRMTPGANVSLKANGEMVASVTADQNGEWVIILDKPLESGTVEFSLNGEEPGSKTPIEGDDVVLVMVPERENADFLERAESGVVAVMTPIDGDGASTILQRPGAGAPKALGDSLSVATLDYGDGGAAVVSGTGVPRHDVRLYLDNGYLGSARVQDDGGWQLSLGAAIPAGQHVLRVDQTIGDGSVSLRIEQPFEAGFSLDPSLAASGVLVQPGNTLWNIARQLYGTGVRYTVIFQENSEQIADPDLIYPGQLFEIPQETARQTDQKPAR